MKTISYRTAKRRAGKIHKYRLGKQWVVVQLDPERGCWVESCPQSYGAACSTIRDAVSFWAGERGYIIG